MKFQLSIYMANKELMNHKTLDLSPRSFMILEPDHCVTNMTTIEVTTILDCQWHMYMVHMYDNLCLLDA